MASPFDELPPIDSDDVPMSPAYADLCPDDVKEPMAGVQQSFDLAPVASPVASPPVAPQAKAKRGKVYQMTWNNYPAKAMWALERVVELGRIQAFGARPEIGAQNKTPHLQGWLQMKTPNQQFKALQKELANLTGAAAGPFLQPARGSIDANRHYCQKPVQDCKCQKCEQERAAPTMSGAYVEKGQPQESEQGRRTDLEEMRLRLQKESLLEVADTDFSAFVHNHNAFAKYQRLHFATLPKPVPRVLVFWGLSGSGKTRAAMALSKSVYVVPPVESGAPVWHDGYDPRVHDTVVFNDFVSQVKYTWLLNYIDRYPVQVPVKGGYVPFVPSTIVFTSIQHPSAWYPSIVDKTELYRRVSECRRFLLPVSSAPSKPKETIVCRDCSQVFDGADDYVVCAVCRLKYPECVSVPPVAGRSTM